MPLPTSHGLLGAAIAAAIHPKIKGVFVFPLFFAAFLANVADFDFAFYLPGDLGFNFLVDYEWHRGFSHSFLFSGIVFLGFALYYGIEQIRTAAAYGLAYSSHLVLDFLTTKTSGGLELFWFLNDRRYRLGLFGMSEHPSRMTVLEILIMVSFEVLIFGLLFLAVFYLRRFYDQKRPPNL